MFSRSRRVSRRALVGLGTASLAVLVTACAAPTPTPAPPKPAAPEPTKPAAPAAAPAATTAPAPTAAAAAPAAATKPAAAPAAAPPKAAQPVAINYWHNSYGAARVALMKEMVQEFQGAFPHITLKVDEQPTQDLRQKILPVFTQGGPGPDIYEDGAVQTQTFSALPHGLAPITKRVTDAGLKDKIPTGAWAAPTQKGEIHGIPLIAFPWFMAYNAKIYGDAGVDGLPTDQAALLPALKKVTNESKDTFGYLNMTDKFVSWTIETLWYNNGVGYFEGSDDARYDYTRPIALNSPKHAEALKYLFEMSAFAPGGVKGTVGKTENDLIAQMAKGTVATIYATAPSIRRVIEQNPKLVGGTDIKVGMFPKGPVRQGNLFTYGVMGLTKGTKEPDAAWEVIKFVSDKWDGKLSAGVGGVPVRTDAVVPAAAEKDWLYPQAKEVIKTAFAQGFFVQYDSFRTALSKGVEAYFLGQMTPEQALASTAKAGEEALKALK
jgi:ABC-type glycerol-3-phosphate transport system substrate-binding protein